MGGANAVSEKNMVYKSLELRPVRFAARRIVDRKTAERLTSIHQYEDVITRDLVFETDRLVYSDCLRDETVTVVAEIEIPSSWWQHFKQDTFPAWLLRRFPVKTKKITRSNSKTFKAMALFPDFVPSYPGDLGKVVYHVLAE